MKNMFILYMLLSFFLTTTECHSTATREQGEVKQSTVDSKRPNQEWRAASFRGLKIGTSTRADMLRIFGTPKSVEAYDEGALSDGTQYYYDADNDIPGEICIAIDSNSSMIRYIELRPNDLSKDQIIKLLGDSYIVTKYDFDDCLGDGESSPLYESPTGSVTRIEYRSRGIAVAVDESNKVQFISYVGEPIGASSSKCK